ncbi:MAG: AAA family ATPase [Planctomycetota bacterium]
MRILAVRGKNLASLARAWEVDFEAEPIGSAGLFAITGPTGSGKSTILDAICLALFNQTPRLSNRAGAPIGSADLPEDQRVTANDVRGLLTRGAASGFAEVDFEGADKKRYRARWDARRARGKADGRLQPVSLSLKLLESDEPIGGKLVETRDEIEERVGLSFDQFKRAVLLAQGDFQAFLDAGAKDRGELLERMTGTDLYTRLSKAVFRRAKAARDDLALLEGSLALITVLPDEERAALTAENDALAAREKDLGAGVDAAKKSLAWFAEWEEKAKDERDAKEQVEIAAAAWKDLTGSGSPPGDGDLKAARTLDVEVRTLEGQIESGATALAERRERLEELEESIESLKAEVADHESELNKLTESLAGEDVAKKLAPEWALHKTSLQDLLDARGKLADAKGEVKEADQRLDNCAKECEDSRGKVERANADLEAAEKELAAAVSERGKLPSDAEIDTLADGLHKLVTFEAESKKLSDAIEALPVAVDACTRAEGALDEAQATFDRLQNQATFEEQRAQLAEGEPCPVCGATHHPWAGEVSPEAASIAAQRGRVADLAGALKKHEGKRAAIAQQKQDAEAALVGLPQPPHGASADSLRTELASLRQRRDDLGELEGKARDSAVAARAAHKKAADHDQECRGALTDAKAGVDRANAAVESAVGLGAKIERRIDEVMGDGEWRASFDKEFVADLTERVEDWIERDEKRKKLDRELPGRRGKVEQQTGVAGVQRGELEEATKAHGALVTRRDDAARKRKAYFGGADSDAVEEALGRMETASTILTERTGVRERLERDRPEQTKDALEAERASAAEELEAAHKRRIEVEGELTADATRRGERGAAADKIDALHRASVPLEALRTLLGSADGSKFRDFAQGLSLRIVLEQANHQLTSLKPRYQLEPVPGHDLEMQVVDRDMGDEVRPTRGLSGGETFLVSLALALGLAEASGDSSAIDSLFIDEGFGTLDAEALETAIATLDALQEGGRTIGVISHVEGLADRLGVRVHVEPRGAGRSSVKVERL